MIARPSRTRHKEELQGMQWGRPHCWLALLLWAGLTTGCGLAPPAAPPPDPAAVGNRPLLYRYPTDPPLVDAAGLRSLVGGFRNKTVLLSFWGTWSKPAVAGLEDLAVLQEQWGPDRLQVISCNLDRADSWTGSVLPALRAAEANYPCVILRAEAKPAVREWLSPNWAYTVPAAFLLDWESRVVRQAVGEEAVARLQSELRSLRFDSLDSQPVPASAEERTILRLTLIDVRNGRSMSLGQVAAPPRDASLLIDAAAERIAQSIDRRANPRLAIPRFATSPAADSSGEDLPRRLAEALRRRGYQDLVTPGRADRMMADSGVSILAAEFEPAVVQGRLACDYLVVGRLHGVAIQSAPNRSLPAGSAE